MFLGRCQDGHPTFGVNCFGDLVIEGGRDVPCLAQSLLREDGYIGSCDGDYLAMISMVLSTYFTDQTVMMSNMYPIEYPGALKDHFGDSLLPSKKKYRKKNWKNPFGTNCAKKIVDVLNAHRR